MTWFLIVIILMLIVALGMLVTIHKEIKMTNEELAQALDDLAAQLNKALGEIIAEIQGLNNVPQAVIDKLNAAKAVAQQLDDLNPDQPPPGP